MARKAKKDAIKASTGGGINADQIHMLTDRYAALKEEMSGTRGEMGNLMKNAENDHGINKKALKLAMDLNGQSDEKRTEFLKAFDQYRHVLGLDNVQQTSLGFGDEESNQAYGNA